MAYNRHAWGKNYPEYHGFGKSYDTLVSLFFLRLRRNFWKKIFCQIFICSKDIFKSNNCRTDYLEIRDGYWHKSPVLGRYCGSGKISELIKSTGSRMLVTLTTTHRQEGHRGFAAHYEGTYTAWIKSFLLMSPFAANVPMSNSLEIFITLHFNIVLLYSHFSIHRQNYRFLKILCLCNSIQRICELVTVFVTFFKITF